MLTTVEQALGGMLAGVSGILLTIEDSVLTILVNVSREKHFAFGSLALSQLARIGMHENAMVCRKSET